LYQQQVLSNARALAASLQQEGFRVVSGGTDSHMFLIDVFAKAIKGKEAERALDEAHITANKNAIPFDTNPPLNPSGIRLGSPAVTTRGFREPEMKEVGRLIARVLNNPKSQHVIENVRHGVAALTDKYPLYEWRRNRAPALAV
jgi:glycine hydroxymethyltransferase